MPGWLGGVSIREASRPAPDPGSVAAALRVLCAMAVPVAAVHLAEVPGLTPFAVFGGFTAVYGRIRDPRRRLQNLAGAAASMVLAVALGLLVPRTPHPSGWSIAVGAGIAGAVGLGSLRWHWRPPGPLFQLIAFSVAGMVTASKLMSLQAIGVTVAAAAGAVVINMVVAPHRHQEDSLPPVRHQSRDDGLTAIEYALGAGIAGSAALATGFDHAYWAMLAAVVPFMAAGPSSRILRATHRLVGTALGLGLSAIFLSVVEPSPLFAITVVIALQAGAELLIRRHYGWAVLIITPLALTMTYLIDHGNVNDLVVDRLTQTAIGVVVAALLIGARSLCSPPTINAV